MRFSARDDIVPAHCETPSRGQTTVPVSSEKESGLSRMRESDAGSLGVQHFDEEVVARHLPAQVFITQVIFGLRAQRSELGKAHENLTEPVRILRIDAERVLQQRCVHLFVHVFDVRLILQQFHICREGEREMTLFLLKDGVSGKWVFKHFTHTSVCARARSGWGPLALS